MQPGVLLLLYVGSDTWRSVVKWCSFEVARLDNADSDTLRVVVVTQTDVQLTARLHRAHLYTHCSLEPSTLYLPGGPEYNKPNGASSLKILSAILDLTGSAFSPFRGQRVIFQHNRPMLLISVIDDSTNDSFNDTVLGAIL